MCIRTISSLSCLRNEYFIFITLQCTLCVTLQIFLRAASVLVVGGALGEMALPFLMGNIIYLNPMNLMYFCLISTCVCILNFLVMLKLASTRGSRHKSNKHGRYFNVNRDSSFVILPENILEI